MTSRRAKDDYPEHLNPFKRLGLRGSFRELKRNFDIRFRRKDPNKNGTQPQVHVAVGDPNLESPQSETVTLRHLDTHHHYKSEIYPRSRFNERVNKAQTLGPSTNDNPFGEDPTQEQNNNEKSTENNFEEESSAQTKPASTGNTKMKTRKRYQRKSRAPPPPNKLGGNTSDTSQSQWSISSYETDCSLAATCHETTYKDHDPIGSHDIHNISEDIINFCHTVDEAGNVDENVVNNNPSIIVSYETDDDIETKFKLKSQEVSDISEIAKNIEPTVETETHENSDNTPDTKCISIVSIAQDSTANIDLEDESAPKAHTLETDAETILNNKSDTTNVHELNNATDEVVDQDSVIKLSNRTSEPETILISKSETTNAHELSDVTGEDSVIKLSCRTSESDDVDDKVNSTEKPDVIANCNVDQTSVADKNIHNKESNEKFPNGIHFVESKSLYIAGSTDNLDLPEPIYKEKVALYITGSCDELNADTVPMSGDRPIPKMRMCKVAPPNNMNNDE